MKAIYKCMHCGAAKEVQLRERFIGWRPADVLNCIFNNAEPRVGQFDQHNCEPGILGVAMCVAVIP